jgi:hypothetical protein
MAAASLSAAECCFRAVNTSATVRVRGTGGAYRTHRITPPSNDPRDGWVKDYILSFAVLD